MYVCLYVRMYIYVYTIYITYIYSEILCQMLWLIVTPQRKQPLNEHSIMQRNVLQYYTLTCYPTKNNMSDTIKTTFESSKDL